MLLGVISYVDAYIQGSVNLYEVLSLFMLFLIWTIISTIYVNYKNKQRNIHTKLLIVQNLSFIFILNRVNIKIYEYSKIDEAVYLKYLDYGDVLISIIFLIFAITYIHFYFAYIYVKAEDKNKLPDFLD